jgi:hypothetical protein
VSSSSRDDGTFLNATVEKWDIKAQRTPHYKLTLTSYIFTKHAPPGISSVEFANMSSTSKSLALGPIQVPIPGFGAMGLSHHGLDTNFTLEEAEPVLLRAVELGSTFWDTAVSSFCFLMSHHLALCKAKPAVFVSHNVRHSGFMRLYVAICAYLCTYNQRYRFFCPPLG